MPSYQVAGTGIDQGNLGCEARSQCTSHSYGENTEITLQVNHCDLI